MPLSMERWRGKVAIVTGASGGIGAAIAQQLVEAGIRVVGLGRRTDEIENLSHQLRNCDGTLHAINTDLNKEEDIFDAFKWTTENLGPVHILVNAAGVFHRTTLMEGDTKFWKDILDTNVLGVCITTREAIKDMRKNNVDGHIIHVNSIAGHAVPVFPMANVYPASKYAITALTETLRQELNGIGSKIKISSISPGIVNTNLFNIGYASTKTELADVLEVHSSLQPCDVADGVTYILATPPHVQVHDLIIKPMGEVF